MSNPLDRALQDRAQGRSSQAEVSFPSKSIKLMMQAAIRRAQHQKREIIVLDDTPVQSRTTSRFGIFWLVSDSRDSPGSATFGRVVSSGKKTRMDVLSSDLYTDHQSSDDSLPDLAAAFGIKSRYNHAENSTNRPRQT